MSQLYHRRRPARPGRLSSLELVACALVLVVVVAMLLVFLLGYHDLPFRLSGGY